MDELIRELGGDRRVIVTSIVQIVEGYTEDGARVATWEARDGDGSGLDIVTALGLIERAKLQMFQTTMADDDDDDDDEDEDEE